MKYLESYFKRINENWYGLILVFFGLVSSIYFGIWAFIEPLSIPDEFKKEDLPKIVSSRRSWHILVVLFLSGYLTLIIDIVLRKKYKGGNLPKQTETIGEDQLKLLRIISDIGLLDGTNQLLGEKYDPKECMKMSKKRLLFMGISGGKWINCEGNQFESFLRKIDSVSGKVRFLLINPKSSGYLRLKNLRDNNVDATEELLRKLLDLSIKYKCLQVRLYDSLPGCRLISIDENVIAISPYRLEKDGFLDSNRGWNNPHVGFTPDSKWSFYNIFESYFFNVWEKSPELTESILN